MLSDTTRALDALNAIPPDIDRDSWVRAGMAAQAAGLDFDAFNDWSAGANNYDERAARETWRSFKPGKGVNAGTLYRMAAEHGGYGLRRQKPQPRPVPRPAPAQKPRPGMSAAEVWSRCEPATIHHPYVVKKDAQGVALDGLRVVPAGDPLTIQRERMAGALVLPVLRPDGSMSTLQFIAVGEVATRRKEQGETDKLFLPGHTVEGWFTVGEVKPGEPVYICEGIGTAWACWRATGRAAVSSFGWSRVKAVAAELSKSHDRLVIVPDVGKEQDAFTIAAEVGASVAAMPEGLPPNSDMCDLAQAEGTDVVEALLNAATEPEPAPRLLKVVDVAGCIAAPSEPTAFAWDGYLPRGVVSMLGAHGGTGKSTIALMLCVSVALGRPLFGADTAQGGAMFVSLEDGERVVRSRLAAICRAWNINPADLAGRLHIVDGTEFPELFDVEGRTGGATTRTYAELRQTVQGLGLSLFVVDNASDAYGGDEIQRRQVRAFIRALGVIAKEQDCAALLLSHVDKATSRGRKSEGGEGYSGSTAWHNSVRSRMFMTRAEDGTLQIEHQKSNLGRCREPIELAWPENGFPQLVEQGNDVVSARLQGRTEDERAAALLRLMAEFEGRGQYCSPGLTSRTNVYAVLESEPAFRKLKLKKDDVKRLVNQCQRAGWLEAVEYRTKDSKVKDRWTVTLQGKVFAAIPPTPPTPPTTEDGEGSEGGEVAPPTPPTCGRGYGGESEKFPAASLAQEGGLDD